MTIPQDPTDRRAGLSAAKRALLEQWVAKKSQGQAPGESDRIPRRPGPAPLSVMQQRLWFMEQLVPGTPAYNITEGIWLGGALQVGALERALSEIVARHEALRFAFVAQPGAEPLQQVSPPAPVMLTPVDVPEGQLQAEVDAEARRPLDLATGPLYRFRLLRAGASLYVLVVTLHHIVSDGWSMGVLAKELLALYSAFAAGKPSPLAPLPVQYGDFAAWQRERLGGDLTARQLAWWKERLGGPVPVLELPTDFPRPPVQSYRGAQHFFDLSPELSAAVRDFSQQAGVTPFMALYAAWVALLHRYTGQTDILCGTPVAGRGRAEVEGLIGFFVNTLVLRTDLGGNPSFRDLTERVKEFALGAFAHQELPFEKLVEELAPQRSLSHQPLFQAVFNLMPGLNGGAPVTSDLKMDISTGGTGTAQFDLMLALVDDGGTYRGFLEYSTDLFTPERMARTAGHYATLLSAALQAPETPVGALPLLTAAETTQIEAWNGASVTPATTIHRLFEARAHATPEATALLWNGGSMTYGELNRRANRLAHLLKRSGVGRETLVGVAAERSPELIAGLLAILKAGGAYVPLDPAYPAERLAFMLADTGLQVLLTQRRLAAPLTANTVIYLDDPLPAEDEGDLPESGDPEDLAYIIYTSGSTGTPKGSLVPHRAIARLVQGADFARLDADQTFLQLAPVSFDASTLEIWGALGNGARLALMDPGAPTLAELAAAIRRYGITILWLTAGLFHLMVEQQLETLLTVRQILAGGDVLSPAHVQKVLAQLPPASRLINGYGPTENTTFTCCYPMTRSTVLPGSVPIGRPIHGTFVRILDRHGLPVPAGVPGELWAGGAGLARGYLNRPELTAERFRDAMYRTGDLARWRDDGTIEFLGRTDDQVKIRGFRIELGEIEHHLNRHPGVAEAAVVARVDRGGERSLVAYIVGSATAADLRTWLKARLPEYMQPAAFVTLDRLPLNPNGKVDRRALPEPSQIAPSHAQGEPQTPMEARLAAIWAEVLGLPRVGTNDNFFEIGGHSLLAIRLLSRVGEAFGVELTLRTLFEGPTVGAMAAAIAQHGTEAGTEVQSLPQIHPQPAAAGLPYPQTYVQQAYLAGRSGYFDLGACGTNFFAEFEVTGAGPAFLNRMNGALRRLIARHDAFRTFLLPDGRQQTLTEAPTYALPVIDLRELTPAEAEARMEPERERMKYAKAAVDRWPLFEFQAYLLADGRIRILSRIDALILDGSSNMLFLKELFRLLEQPEAALEPYTCSFRDYVQGLEAIRESELFERSKQYWLGRVAELPPAPELPLVMQPTPTMESRTTGRADYLLSPAEWTALTARAAKAGLTPSAAVLTALTDVIGAYSASPRFTISLVVSYRFPMHPDINRMIGNFNCITLLGLDGEGGSFTERAHRLQLQLSADLEHMYYPGFLVLQEWNKRLGGGARCLSPVLANSLIEYSHSVYEARQLDRGGVTTPDGAINLMDGHFTIPQVTIEPIFGVEPDGSLAGQWVALESLYPPGLHAAMFADLKALLQRLAAGVEAWSAGPLVAATDAATQERVAAIWRDVLELPQVGAHDNFFALGGTSQSALRMIAAVEAAFGRRLPLTILADGPTVARIAAIVKD